MILKRFKVENFRSVIDSGWIDCENITSLVGVNEAGKSNLLLALWKLNPARAEGDAEIESRDDMPRSFYTDWKDNPQDIKFITAEFELSDALAKKISGMCTCEENLVKIVHIARYFDGNFEVEFPNFKKLDVVTSEFLKSELITQQSKVTNLTEVVEKSPATEDEEHTEANENGIKDKVLQTLSSCSKRPCEIF